MNNLWIETGWISLNHVGETLCGDKVEVHGGGEEDLTLVLADGLGSGVKANILLYDRQYHVIITLIRDVTEHETLRAQGAEMRRQTAEITGKVIDKQMRIVQEIASLLGETTAETQIALTKLKDAVTHE